MPKAKYLLEATVGTVAGSVAVTVRRLADNQTISFIPAPLVISDITLVSPANPGSQGVLRIFRDGVNVYNTPPLLLPFLPAFSKLKGLFKVMVSGQAQNQITFDVFSNNSAWLWLRNFKVYSRSRRINKLKN